MDTHSTQSINEAIQNVAISASSNSSISQPSISMSKGHSEISPSIIRRRGPTKRSLTSPTIKRSASSPNVRTMASSEVSSTSMSEKRRNKLGYHRTSVACGHCRRRKIRCLLDSVDPRGRCSNCIRLKKECKFYPVDQQPSLETRARSGSKAEASSNDAETSTSSSPVHQAGSTVVEEIESYHHLQTHPLQPNEDNQGYYPYSASTLSPAGRPPLSALTYEVPHTFDPPSSWEHSPFSSQSSQSLAVERSFPEDASGAFWRPGGSPLTGAYPPSQFSMHSSSLSMTPSSHGSRDGFVPQRARDGRGWHPPQGPVRSMSLVTPEELPAHYQARYFQSPIASGVHASTHYGHASHDTVAGESHSTTERHPTLRQSQTAQQVGFTFPQWGAYQQTDTQTVGSSAQGLPREWYTRSPHLAQVREESGSSHHYQPPTGPSPHERNYG